MKNKFHILVYTLDVKEIPNVYLKCYSIDFDDAKTSVWLLLKFTEPLRKTKHEAGSSRVSKMY